MPPMFQVAAASSILGSKLSLWGRREVNKFPRQRTLPRAPISESSRIKFKSQPQNIWSSGNRHVVLWDWARKSVWHVQIGIAIHTASSRHHMILLRYILTVIDGGWARGENASPEQSLETYSLSSQLLWPLFVMNCYVAVSWVFFIILCVWFLFALLPENLPARLGRSRNSEA